MIPLPPRPTAGSRAGRAGSVLDRLPPPPLSDKLRRAVWTMAWLIAFRPTPVVFHGWRRLMLRMFGADVHASARIYPSCRIFAPWHVGFGRDVVVGGDTRLYSVAPIILEEGSVVSQGAHLCGATHDFHSPDFSLLAGTIRIGRHSWVAADAFVGPGIRIGDRAVVLARAVVTRDVPPGEIVSGNPSRTIGFRDPQGRNVL
jgi:putative colanic acid biosynthesis acetyltransferase WcaF